MADDNNTDSIQNKAGLSPGDPGYVDPTKSGVHAPGSFSGESPLAIAARAAKEKRAAMASKDTMLKALAPSPAPSPIPK
jgi:hypothetical protein